MNSEGTRCGHDCGYSSARVDLRPRIADDALALATCVAISRGSDRGPAAAVARRERPPLARYSWGRHGVDGTWPSTDSAPRVACNNTPRYSRRCKIVAASRGTHTRWDLQLSEASVSTAAAASSSPTVAIKHKSASAAIGACGLGSARLVAPATCRVVFGAALVGSSSTSTTASDSQIITAAAVAHLNTTPTATATTTTGAASRSCGSTSPAAVGASRASRCAGGTAATSSSSSSYRDAQGDRHGFGQ